MVLIETRAWADTSGAPSPFSLSQPKQANYLWKPLRWRHNEHDGVANHQTHGCLLGRLFRRRSKNASKPRVTGLCVRNSPGPMKSPHKEPVTRKMVPFDDVIMIWRHWCQKWVSRARKSNYILQFTVGCNYLSLPEIPASGQKQVSPAGISNYILQFTVGCNYLSLLEIPASCQKQVSPAGTSNYILQFKWFSARLQHLQILQFCTKPS